MRCCFSAQALHVHLTATITVLVRPLLLGHVCAMSHGGGATHACTLRSVETTAVTIMECVRQWMYVAVFQGILESTARI